MIVTLHIGTEKTGTTSIQAILAANRARLRRAGVLFPNAFQLRRWAPGAGLAATLGQVRHTLMAVLFARHEEMTWLDKSCGINSIDQRDAQRQIALDRLAAEIREHRPKTLLLSSEHFSSTLHDDGEIADIRKALEAVGAKEFRVIMFVRNQISMVESWYSTSVKGGMAKPLPDVPYSDLDAYLSLNAQAERWSRIFGQDAMRLISFDEMIRERQPLWASFALACGLDALQDGALKMVKPLNLSLDAHNTEVLRRYNEAKRARYPIAATAAMIMACEKRSSGPGGSVPERLRQEIVTNCSADNAALERAYFDGRPVLRFPD